jgi:hypothetical protein
MHTCRCGCGSLVSKKRVFLNKEHHIAWMYAGGAREMNALLPDEVRERGGRTTGKRAHESGRLKEASLKGAARSKEIAATVRTRLGK